MIQVFILAITLFFTGTATSAVITSENKAERYFEMIKNNPQQLHLFLRDFPKGGDLHNHQSGATFAENLMRYALNDSLCINRETYTAFVDASCKEQDLLKNAIQDIHFYDALIDAWSMRHFIVSKESGHDHFFNTFGKFNALTKHHHGEMLSEIVERAAKQNELYVELMVTADNNASGLLGQKLGYDADFAKMREKLLAADFDKIIKGISTNLDQDDAKKQTLLACHTKQPKPGCRVTVRYQYQVLREQAPEMVFAQLLAGFEAVMKDKRVVALNMVQPEDGPISMRDYKLHMQMVGYLHNVYPNVHISLHAGELNNTLVPPEGLAFHINDAVRVAHANRIGHGVDILEEDNAMQLLKEMADKDILVEINLSSNANILNVQGRNHPLSSYSNAGVPVALSTDDEGINRGDLTKEYELAVSDQQLNYLRLKQLARNSISYAFIPGKNLWQDRNYHYVASECKNDTLGSKNISLSCHLFLAASEKATLQWKLEKQFIDFENLF